MENGDVSGSLNDPPGKRNGVHLHDADRQTSHAGTVFTILRLARLPGLRRPRLIRQTTFTPRVNVPELGCALPDCTEGIGAALRTGLEASALWERYPYWFEGATPWSLAVWERRP